MGKQIVYNGVFVTLETQEKPVRAGYMIVNDDKIEGIWEGEPSDTLLSGAEKTIDATGKWVMPGLMNTHGHTGSTLLRGAGDDLPLQKWLTDVMWPMEKQLTKEMTRAATSLAILEMMKSGTTSFLDMYHLHMDQTAELVLTSQMNGVLCRGMIGLCSVEEQKDKLTESLALYDSWNGAGEGKLKVMLAPHAPYTCPPDFLDMIICAAKDKSIPLHTHLAETRKEVHDHVEKYGKRPAEHLHELGFFDGSSLIAHGVHLSEDELDLLADKNVAVSHNPMSNLKLGSGIADIKRMRAKGIRVAIGTDSSASNNNLDLFEELRFAALIHKGTNEDPTVTNAFDILKMGTEEGAKALGFTHKGVLAKDYDADFIFIDPQAAHFMPLEQNRVLSHLVYASKGSDVTDVFIKGKRVVQNRVSLTLDEEKILYEANHILAPLI
ncbi:amidohydrolase [Alteribacter populi]|uniref:amidohydrolase n=1 Tax=Alteribacter populi TaxID=2011011 RepID=UPI000BBAD841|nr:amidohydrolase [Alteribacter populi]